VGRSEEPRSNLATGEYWAGRVSAVGFAFVLPPLGGAFLDRWLGTSPIFILLGAVLGFGLGMMYILRLAKDGAPRPPGNGARSGPRE
jgi:F0F1-type ATP synthase assembly protein I